ncbi:MAG: hypothetical protein H6625_13770 [Bdellovibrionaceae bacterium]|nr:hypothetical protein [Pseudobdellovibrionaceae bacterium]
MLFFFVATLISPSSFAEKNEGCEQVLNHAHHPVVNSVTQHLLNLALSKRLLSQSDQELKLRGIEHSCTTVSFVNALQGVISYQKGNTDFEISAAALVEELIEDLTKLLHRDVKTQGISIGIVYKSFLKLAERRFGLNIGTDMGVIYSAITEEILEPKANQVLLIGVDNQSSRGHTMILLEANKTSKQLSVIDPSFPDRILEPSYESVNIGNRPTLRLKYDNGWRSEIITEVFPLVALPQAK